MKKLETTEDDIAEVIYFMADDEHSIIQNIGIALQVEYVPGGIRHKHHPSLYTRVGNEFWKSLQYELYELICNAKTKEPNFFVEEIVSGSITDIVTAYLSILVSQLSIPIAIAVPACSLIIKTGIRRFCQTSIKRPKRSIKEILSEKEKETGSAPKRPEKQMKKKSFPKKSSKSTK